LDAAQPRGGIELIGEYALPLPMTIIAELLGIPPADRAKFRARSAGMVSVSTGADLVRVLPRIWLLIRQLRALFRERRAAPRDDLISALAQVEEAGDRLSEDELLAMAVLLLIAGHETTVNLIGNGTLALLQQPEHAELLRRDASLIGPAIEELLRYAGPLALATERFAREDMEIGGRVIRRGEQVLAVLCSANRDERQFDEPDTLDLAREPNRHLAFGQGIHYCLGAPLARLERQVAIETLLRRFPGLRPAGAPESLRWRNGLFIRGLEGLPLIF
jgi:cytochrome P450 PksS